MATVKRILQKAGCSKCAKEQLTLEIDKPIENTHLSFFANTRFSQSQSYTKLGLLYLESKTLIAVGTFGNNRLQIKCKSASCVNDIKELEAILSMI